MARIWMRRAAPRGAGPGPAAPPPEDQRSDWRNRRIDRLERIYMVANAGLWGDAATMLAIAECIERDEPAETRSER